MKSWTSAFSVSSPIAALDERWMQPGWCGAAAGRAASPSRRARPRPASPRPARPGRRLLPAAGSCCPARATLVPPHGRAKGRGPNAAG